MKKETKELITGLKNWYEKFRSAVPLTFYTEWAVGDGKGYADEGASNMDKVIALLDNLEKTEACLANGGLVRDAKGNWLASGTRVKYIRHNADGDWHTGTIDFDVTNLSWYLDTDSGDYLYLAKGYYEVDTFEKLDD